MNKKELIQFLKENMSISLINGTCCDSPYINVSIFIGDELICTSEDLFL